MSDIVRHKLVRYKITEINAAAGKQSVTRALSGEEYLANPFRRFEDMQMLRHTKTLGIVEVGSDRLESADCGG